MLSDTNLETLPKIFDGIEGWLWPDAGWLTAYLMNGTRDRFHADQNAVVEFGTYKGKYLSLLYHLTEQERATVLGVDIFTLTTPEEVAAGILELLGDSSRLQFISADTKTLTHQDVSSALDGKKARFISIDAEHKAKPVFHDLGLAQEILSDGGIIAVDDFTNVHCPGVTEGAINFLLSEENKRLAPFCSSCNKLFITTEDSHHEYYTMTRKFIDDVSFTTSHTRFFTRSASQNNQELCGYPLWVLSHVKAASDPEEQKVIQRIRN